eukprot:scaffold37104_cov183-Amphora_coffeaeformis.AAC.5
MASFLESLYVWLDKQGGRTCFLTMSNKIKRLHEHELRNLMVQQEEGIGVAVFYCTQHSWTLDKYKEWDIEEDGAEDGSPSNSSKIRSHDGTRRYCSVLDATTQKFASAGGSAMWMLQLTTTEIDQVLKFYLDECSILGDLMSFSLGPKSPRAKTCLYSSTVNESGETLYSMVSQRAMYLYKHAMAMNNPAFLGWVIEADLFQRCKSGSLQLKRKKDGGDTEDVEIESHTGKAVSGYTVHSVELTFTVPFRVTASKVESSGLLSHFTRYGTSQSVTGQTGNNRWTQGKEQDQIHVYGLDMSSMDYSDPALY